MAVERHPRVAEAESVICQLKDVISSRVVMDSAGGVEEIHVFTESVRPPKQVVRDIESALMAELGMEIDHRRVSVAQIQGAVQTESRLHQARLKFSQVSLSLHGSCAEAAVRLSKGDEIYVGTAEGQSSSHGQMRLIATATLKAVEDSGAHDGMLVIEDIQTMNLSGRNVVIMLLSMTNDRGEEYLSGSAVVKQDLWKAVVNATLNAVNRRLSVED